jgi:hypothetical protein
MTKLKFIPEGRITGTSRGRWDDAALREPLNSRWL